MKESKSKKECVELLSSDAKVILDSCTHLHLNTALCGVVVNDESKKVQEFRLSLFAVSAKIECVKSLVLDILNDIVKL